jgi:hypothetical protein
MGGKALEGLAAVGMAGLMEDRDYLLAFLGRE